MRTLKEEMQLKREQAHAKCSEKENPSVEKSMRVSIWDGSFFGIMSGFSEPFLIPFALLFNAPNILISLLSTLPVLIGSIIQLFAPRILSALNSRRRYLIFFFILQGAAWLFLPWVALVPDKQLGLFLCVLLAVGSVSISHAVSTVWLSYMGDLVPERRRASYFGRRNAIIGIITFIATLSAGFMVKDFSNVYLGFGVLFTVAALARWLSALAMSRSRELPTKLPKRGEFSLTGFFQRAPRSDFGRYVTFSMFMRFAAYIASPFFVVYQLKVLHLDYFSFTILQGASVVGSVLALQLWGKAIEWQGTRRVLVLSSVLIGFVPIIYMTSSYFPMLLLFELFSGASWAGFNLSSQNYALEATTPESRPYVFSYSSLLNNISIFIAGLAGGLLLSEMTGPGELSAAPFLALFAISGGLRLLVAIGGSSRLRELRFVQITFGEGIVSSFVSILPQQGVVVASSMPEPGAFREEVVRDLDIKRNVEEQLKELGEGEDIVERMGPEEKELYEKKWIEKVKK